MQYVYAYAAAALVFFALDIVWLAGVARNFYFARLGELVRDKPDLIIAGVFYVGYIAGIVYFAIAPALAGGGVLRALVTGALVGLLAYGTYDLTNFATLRGYPADVAIIDILWGTFLTAIAAGAGCWAAMRFTS